MKMLGFSPLAGIRWIERVAPVELNPSYLLFQSPCGDSLD